MVKTTGPMFSLDARGALGDAVIFSKGKKSSFAKKFHKPKNPRSDKQVARRAMTKWLTQTWSQLDPTYHDNFNAMADLWNIAPYHAFLKFNSNRWTSWLMPAVDFPVATSMTITSNDESFTKQGRVYSFEIKYNHANNPSISIAIEIRTLGPSSWDNDRIKVILGPPSFVIGPIYRFTGQWTAPTDATYLFRAKIGSRYGAVSQILFIE